MTRKRYIKLLMSHGVSRNQAQESAYQVVSTGCSYEKGYKLWKLANSIYNPSDTLSEAVSKLSKEINRVFTAAALAISAFGSTLTAALQEPSPYGGICPRCGGSGMEYVEGSLSDTSPPKYRVCSQCMGTGKEMKGVE